MTLAGAEGFRRNALLHQGLERRSELVKTNRRALKAVTDEQGITPGWDDDLDGKENPYYLAAQAGVNLISSWVKSIVLRRSMASKDKHGNPILSAIAWKRYDSFVSLTIKERRRLGMVEVEAKVDRYA